MSEMKKSLWKGSADALINTHKKNMLENVRLPRIKNAQTWKSTAMPQRGGKPKGLLYRTQLSTSNQVPIAQLPHVPRVLYYQLCQAKTVSLAAAAASPRGADEGRRDDAAAARQALRLPPLKFNGGGDAALAPEEEQHQRHAGGGSKWRSGCKCTRCKLMRVDFSENAARYEHWGQYPCVPDAVINRDGTATSSSDDSDADSGSGVGAQLAEPAATAGQ